MLEKTWYQFQDEAYRKIAIDWLNSNNIKYITEA